MEQQKKRWYQTWWGWLILICFWWIATPIAIYQSKLSKKTKKISYGIYAVFLLIIIAGAFTADKEDFSSAKAGNEIINQKSEKVPKNNVDDKKDVEKKVKSEKERVKEKFQKYETEHLELWNNMIKAMQKGDIYTAYEYADKSKTAIFEIWKDLNNFKCNKTGDFEFDKQCEETVKLGENAYLSKQEATEKLLKWFDDFQSPKKANEAKKSLEEGSEYWQTFIIKLAALTMTEEDLKNIKSQNNNKK
nr:MAG TPA: hypothetical protein [Caudoviricetes sp.]